MVEELLSKTVCNSLKPMHGYRGLAEKFIVRFSNPVKSVLRAFGNDKSSFLPQYVKIETTNACNGRCVYCPRDKMNREIGVMDDVLFEKIVDECSRLRIQSVHLQNYGEPLLDRKLVDRVKYIKNRNIPHVMIFSNGSLLTLEKVSGLVDAGLDEISVSLDPGGSDRHDKTRLGLPYDTITKNLEALASYKKELGNAKPSIIITSAISDDNAGNVDLFFEKWKPLVDRIDLQPTHNWGQGKEVLISERLPCSRLWNTFTILWDGTVSMCCVDFDGNYIMGDVSKSTIEEIWNGEKYKNARWENLGSVEDMNPLCNLCKLPLKDSPLWIKKLLPVFRK